MPQKIEYVNFEAILPGEHKENEVRMCMGYRFEGGVHRSRISEADAVKAGRVLTAYFGAKFRRVDDDVSEDQTDERAEGSEGKTQEVGGDAAASVGRTEGASSDGSGNGKAKTRKGKRQAAAKDGEERSGGDHEGSPSETDELV